MKSVSMYCKHLRSIGRRGNFCTSRAAYKYHLFAFSAEGAPFGSWVPDICGGKEGLNCHGKGGLVLQQCPFFRHTWKGGNVDEG